MIYIIIFLIIMFIVLYYGYNNYLEKQKIKEEEQILDGIKNELSQFLLSANDMLIVFDLETNGLVPENSSVLSCSAIKYKLIKYSELEELDRFNRFYFPKERFRKTATDINRLTKEKITDLRKNVEYPKHFISDKGFGEFCNGVNSFVAHNIEFDRAFVEFLKGKNLFCTMKSNTLIVKAKWLESKQGWKWPTLGETVGYYGIAIDGFLHDSETDVKLTSKILKSMINKFYKN